jgi:diadenosine tetraphosphate (Ap4A) HIT family hydrolase
MATNECVFCGIIQGTEKTDLVFMDDQALICLALGFSNLHHIIIAPPQHINNLADLPLKQFQYLNYLSYLTQRALLELAGITQIKLLMSGTKVRRHAHEHIYGTTTDMTWDETIQMFGNNLPTVSTPQQKEDLRRYLQSSLHKDVQ